ncbi:MAG: putative metal-dependent hydrolase [Caldilineaceae bacterium]
MTNEAIRQTLIEKISALPAQIAALTTGLSSDELTTAYIPGEWTVAQNVHHLADSHMNSYIRCKLIATEEQPPLKPYDQDQWARFPDATNADIAGSLALLTALHGRWVTFWQNLSAEDWARTGYHPENGVVALDQQLVLYAEHGEAHIEQIQRTLAHK